LEVATRVEDRDAVLRPFDDVLPVETDVEGLCEDVQVDVVVGQHIKYAERLDG
jgi:hypothetical protein